MFRMIIWTYGKLPWSIATTTHGLSGAVCRSEQGVQPPTLLMTKTTWLLDFICVWKEGRETERAGRGGGGGGGGECWLL